MYLLKSNEIIYRDEMDKLLQFEKKSLGNFPNLPPFIKKLDEISIQIGFGEKQKYAEQKPHMIVNQSKMEEYIRILYNLNIHFEIPKNRNIFKFGWKGQYTPMFAENQNFYYEIACWYYNYAILYFNQALALMKTEDPKNMKMALQFLRSSQWGFIETKKNVQNCSGTGMLLSEFRQNDINACQQLAEAYSYKCFYLMKPKFGDNMELQLSLEKQICVSFTKALEHLKQTEGKQFLHLKELIEECNLHKSFHQTKICLEQLRIYEFKHDEDCSQGYIGYVLGYLQILKKNRKDFEKAIKLFKETESQGLLEKIDQETSRIKDIELKIKEVFKCPVITEDKLPLGPDFANPISPVDQPHVYKKLQEISDSCQNHYSQYYKQIENEIQLNINQSKNNLNAISEDISREKLEFYKNNNIDVILNMSHQKNQEEDFKLLINEILKINGGQDGYQNIFHQLKNYGDENDAQATQIKYIIESDYKKDKEFEMTCGIKVLSIKEASNGLLENFTKHGITLTDLRKKDILLFQKYELFKPFLIDLTSGKALENFQNNKVDLTQSENVKELIKKHELLKNIFTVHLEPSHNQILEYIKGLKLDLILHDIFVNKRTKNDIFEEFQQNINEKIEEFRNKVAMIRKGFQKLLEIAEKVKLELPNNNNTLNYQQKFLSDCNELKLLYQQCLHNLELHDNLKKGGAVLHQVMGDYLLSKDTQKQEILKHKQNLDQLNFQNFGYQQSNQPKPHGY